MSPADGGIRRPPRLPRSQGRVQRKRVRVDAHRVRRDAIEDSEVLLIEPPAHDRLVAEVPGYAASFRNGLQRHAAAKDQRIAESLSASAEERYLNFLTTYPTIATRVPQFMLASYLGVTPETLSRIRKNLSRKPAAAHRQASRSPR